MELDKLREIFAEEIKNHKENCYCSYNTKCRNCDGKETLQEIWKKIENCSK